MMMDTTAATSMDEQAATFAFDVMPIPVPDGVEPLTASPGGAGLAILEDVADETKQAAFELVKFLVSPEIQARWAANTGYFPVRSEEHTSELQSRGHLVCRLLLEQKT